MKKLLPWYWRSLPLQQRTGSQVFATLFLKPNAIATLLESPYPTPVDRPQLGRYSICAGAPRILDGRLQLWTPNVGDILPFLKELLQKGREGAAQLLATDLVADVTDGAGAIFTKNSLDANPFTGGWLGWLGYDLAWEIERLPKIKPDLLPFPVAYWYEPECFAVLDHWEQSLWLAATKEAQLNQMQSHLEIGDGENYSRMPDTRFLMPDAHFLTSQTEYETAVRQVKKYIKAGDIFQANLSLRFEVTTTADSWAIYRALQQINPSPFASYWQTPWGSVISCSPERLVQLQGRDCQTRPIAGTRPRGATPESDRQQARDLLANAKEKAEHIMLVDLERNDLGRVSEWGSVVVDELLTIERYSHVIHLVSNIKGILQFNRSPIDLIRALFPGGTITGCPKVRCMEIIEELEPVRRNLFYGSCGYLDWRGYLDLNILIRTLLLSPNSPQAGAATVWGQVGAGIVADSDPEKEWYESLDKARAQLTALNLAGMPLLGKGNDRTSLNRFI